MERITLDVDTWQNGQHESMAVLRIGNQSVVANSYKGIKDAKSKLKADVLKIVEDSEKTRIACRRMFLLEGGEVALVEWKYGTYWVLIARPGCEHAGATSGNFTFDTACEYVRKNTVVISEVSY